MVMTCPRCHHGNPSLARFCGQCGLMLAGAVGESLTPGRIRPPEPLAPPDGFEPCEGAVDLWCRWESSWGGSMLLSTEGIAVIVFNGGYSLADASLRIRGVDETGQELFSVDREVAALPRGDKVTLEIHSYELPNAAAAALKVNLVSAEFARED